MAAPTALWRFVLLYYTLYFLPFPLDVFGGLSALPPPVSWIGQVPGEVTRLYEAGVNALAVWVGENILQLGHGAVKIQPTGSGDTMAQYVRVFNLAVAAAIGTMVWPFIRSERLSSPRVDAAFRVYLRYALASVLLSYGFAKLPPLQFQPPGPDLLVRTYGDSSPMGLLWTFMGYSMAYTMFAGLAEIVPGLLLMFRTTTTLGAMLGGATMLNVAMLNFAYDVPVKLYSLHLLLAALVIAAPDLARLIKVFVRNEPVPAVRLRAVEPRTRRGAWLKAVYVLLLLSGNIGGSYQAWYRFGPGAPKPEIAGVYDVESFAVNGDVKPPLWTDESRWRRLLVSHRGVLVMQRMGDRNERFSYKHDPQTGNLVLTVVGGGESFTLTSTKAADGRLVLEGPFRGGHIRAELHKVPDRVYPLQTRGFHWIQELPYNR